MHRARSSVALVLLLASLLTACGTGPPDHVRIGVVAPLTGDRAFLGEELVRGAQLAVEELNDRGGLLGAPVELVVEDDGELVSLPGQLADLAERARVSAIIGPEAPAVLLGPRSPLSRREVPAVLASAFAGDLDEAASTVVRTVPSARDQAAALGRWLHDVRRTQRVAVLIADRVEGGLVEQALREGFGDADVEVAAVGRADPDATQLAPAVAALRRDAPDVGAVLLWGAPPTVARATLAVRQLGWDVQVAVPSSSFVSEFRTLTGDASEGVVLPFPFDDAWFGPELLTWMLRYHRAYGLSALPELDTLVLDVPVVAVAAYDAVGLVAQAVRAAASREPAAVARAITQVEHDGILRVYDPSSAEAWTASDLFVARFHRLAVTYDVDPRAPERAGELLWRQQMDAQYLPPALLEGPAGAVLRRLVAEGREDVPPYEPPAPPPGPVARPGTDGGDPGTGR